MTEYIGERYELSKLLQNICIKYNLLFIDPVTEITKKGYNINDLIHDVINEKLFGFVEVDIKVPDELYDKFSEMSPIFKNIAIDSSKKDIILPIMGIFSLQSGIKYPKGVQQPFSAPGQKKSSHTTPTTKSTTQTLVAS